jgi:hypothetical protein
MANDYKSYSHPGEYEYLKLKHQIKLKRDYLRKKRKKK